MIQPSPKNGVGGMPNNSGGWGVGCPWLWPITRPHPFTRYVMFMFVICLCYRPFTRYTKSCIVIGVGIIWLCGVHCKVPHGLLSSMGLGGNGAVNAWHTHMFVPQCTMDYQPHHPTLNCPPFGDILVGLPRWIATTITIQESVLHHPLVRHPGVTDTRITGTIHIPITACPSRPNFGYKVGIALPQCATVTMVLCINPHTAVYTCFEELVSCTPPVPLCCNTT